MNRQNGFFIIFACFISLLTTSRKHAWFLFLFLFINTNTSIGFSKNVDSARTLNIRNYSGRVMKCHDGDTCQVLINGKKEKIRLSGIDAPEIDQAGGKQAQATLEKLILNKNVILVCEGFSFKRSTCFLSHNKIDINAEMVRLGMAWDYPKFSQKKYEHLMKNAQMNKVGIWKLNKKITSPYCFRNKKIHKCKTMPTFMDYDNN